MDPALLEEFVLEATHALRDVEQDMLVIERDGNADPATMSRIFRAIHTVKGSSAVLGLAAVEKLGHRFETLLDLLRRQQRRVTPKVIDVLLQCLDVLNQMIGQPDFGNGLDLAPTLALLDPLIADQPPPGPPTLPGNGSATVLDLAVAVAAAPPSVEVPARQEPDAVIDPHDKLMRVRVRFLDDLLQLTGNMVMARNQLLSKYNFANDPAFLTLSQCVTQVHQRIVKTRMQPIGTLFDRCERQVRDLARQLGKEVTLTVSGRDLELDRSVLDAFADPLTHLIRNALDHGLEPPADRLASGKSRAGHLKLSAREQSGEILLAVEDDGRGIDPDNIREKAVARGLLTTDQAAALTRRAVVDLIFHPGFSTRDVATNLSGRGVGLDVVRTNLKGLGGVVEVQSAPGKSTVFLVRLPLAQALVSSSLISALIVTCGGERYAIPQTAVDEIIRMDPDRDKNPLCTLNGRTIYQLREVVLPVVALSRVLQRGGTDGEVEDGRILIVMQFREQLFGLQVDAILGVEEIVVRPLPALVKNCRLFSGHTVMGNGQVALILDGNGIIDDQQLSFADDSQVTYSLLSEPRDRADGRQRLVVFGFADHEYFAIPLEMVSLIEKVKLSAIRRVGSHEYIQVAQRTLPLMRLDELMPVGKLPSLDHGYLIIPSRVSFPIAILAGRHVSVVDVSQHYESRLSDGQGTLGTFLHEDKFIVLLDLYRLFERHSPERFKQPSVEQRPTHLLLAEDSPFFQNLIRSYLEHPPRQLTVVGDGEAALKLLQTHPEQFDMLVSDIEMPKMDGFTLVRKIRADPILRGLPVIAVTSLATPEHIDRGMQAGFDSYLIKVDKELLIATINRYVEKAARYRASFATRQEG